MNHISQDDFYHREQLRDLVHRIDRDADAVVVEGRHDKEVLEHLGLSVRVFTCAGRIPTEFCNTVGRVSSHVVMLTDFDSHGKELNREMSRMLSEKTDVMHAYREEFGALLTSKGRHCIEDIRPLLGDPEKHFKQAQLDRLFTGLS